MPNVRRQINLKGDILYRIGMEQTVTTHNVTAEVRSVCCSSSSCRVRGRSSRRRPGLQLVALRLRLRPPVAAASPSTRSRAPDASPRRSRSSSRCRAANDAKAAALVVRGACSTREHNHRARRLLYGTTPLVTDE